MPFGMGKVGAGSKTKAGVFDAANSGESRKKRSPQEPPPKGQRRDGRGGCGGKPTTDGDTQTPSSPDDVENVRRKRSPRPPPRGPPCGPPPNEDEDNGEMNDNQRDKCGPPPRRPPPCNENDYDKDDNEVSKNDKMNDGQRRGKCGRGPPRRGPPPNKEENDNDDLQTTPETESFRKKRNSNIEKEHKLTKRSEKVRVRRCNGGKKKRRTTPTPDGETPESPEGDVENVRRKRQTIKTLQTVRFDNEIFRQKRQQTNDPDGVVPHNAEKRDALGDFVDGVSRVVKKFVSFFQSESAEVN